mgnify:CR=1 FL=1
MRKIACAALAVATLCGCVSVEAGQTQTMEIPAHKRTYYYSAQTSAVKDNCLPARLLHVLGHIRSKTGVKPILTSGKRSHGRRGSMHRHCKAADIRVPGVKDSVVIAAARTAPGIGGIGRYCNGIIHVDVGPRREWTKCR